MSTTLDNQVECPICLQKIDQGFIEKHVDKCLLKSVEKPVTRNKNKSSSFFNKQNAKRGAKNEVVSSTVTSKKIKCDFDDDINGKDNISKDEGCSTSKQMLSDDDVAIQKESNEVCNEDLLNPKSQLVASFFNKKSLRQRKNDTKNNINKKVATTIDLTYYNENENEKSKPGENIDNVMHDENNCCVNSEARKNVKANLDVSENSENESLSTNISAAKTNSDNNDCEAIDDPEENSHLDAFFQTNVSTSQSNVINKSLNDLDENTSNCTPQKEKEGVGKMMVKIKTPPMTTFQQELFNMSQGFEATPSPPATSNFRVTNGNPTAVNISQSRKQLTKASLSAKTNINNKMTDIPRILNPDIKEHKQEKVKEKVKEITLGKLPLAEQMRPRTFDEYVGQDAVGTQKLLKELFNNNRVPSMILWGPPGCGKTTLAHIISYQCKSGNRYRFVSLSATMSGVNDVKEAVKVAKNEKRLTQKHTVLFIDEVHRFNKMQQDSFLPHIEDGTIVLIGATTENPSFHLNNALLSRCRIVVLNQLNVDNIMKILRNAVSRLGGVETMAQQQNGATNCRFILEDGAVDLLADYSNGDARIALTSLDMLLQAKINSNMDTKNSPPTITCEQIKEELKRKHVNYDRKGDEHYHIISAFQKSIRGGDQDAAIYWLARMLEGGEDPLYIARRLVVISSEDIGIADPTALNQAVSAYQACQFVGMPECALVLAQVTTYLSNAPKSIASYSAYNKAKKFIKDFNGPQPSVPPHLRNAPTKLMKNLGYGKGYKYTPDFDEGEGEQNYLPEDITGTKFFT